MYRIVSYGQQSHNVNTIAIQLWLNFFPGFSLLYIGSPIEMAGDLLPPCRLSPRLRWDPRCPCFFYRHLSVFGLLSSFLFLPGMPVLGTNYFHYVLIVPSHQMPSPFQLFLCNLFGCLCYSGCSYAILISHLILFLLLPTSISTSSSHSSMSLLLVFLLLPMSLLCTLLVWKSYWFVDLSL